LESLEDGNPLGRSKAGAHLGDVTQKWQFQDLDCSSGYLYSTAGAA
jgi:hypothetical protein